jgi:hypothetical protein
MFAAGDRCRRLLRPTSAKPLPNAAPRSLGIPLSDDATYTQEVKTIWTGRMAQAAGKYGESAPMATVCCNACRTCVTTNIIGMVTAAVAGAGYAVANLAKRRIAPRSGS